MRAAHGGKQEEARMMSPRGFEKNNSHCVLECTRRKLSCMLTTRGGLGGDDLSGV